MGPAVTWTPVLQKHFLFLRRGNSLLLVLRHCRCPCYAQIVPFGVKTSCSQPNHGLRDHFLSGRNHCSLWRLQWSLLLQILRPSWSLHHKRAKQLRIRSRAPLFEQGNQRDLEFKLASSVTNSFQAAPAYIPSSFMPANAEDETTIRRE